MLPVQRRSDVSYCRLADSVQYDEETEKAYFAMPLTEKMTVDELFRKIGSFPVTTPQ